MQKAIQLVNSVRRNKKLYIVTDGCGGPFDGLGGLVERTGSSRLLFGTRIPILHAEASKLVIEQSKINTADREKILGGNAADLLSLTR
jgi:predicted TIM-barrel fold metal-dependent hydrolase